MQQIVDQNNSIYSKQKSSYKQLHTNSDLEKNVLPTDQYDQISVESLLMNESSEVTPVILRNLTKKEPKIEEFYSYAFFAFEEGYQMCLKVDKDGYGSGEGTHVSVFLYLMKGPHDDKLEQSDHWPLRGTFTIELLNQFNDSDHYSRMIQFHHHLWDECSNRVLVGVMANSGRGQSHFISNDTHNYNNYYRDDSFIFRVSYEDTEPSNQVAPVTFKLGNFAQWVKTKEVWLSSSFFAFSEGYQMFLSIEAASDDEDTHVSVFLYLMKGPHDDKLDQSGHWP